MTGSSFLPLGRSGDGVVGLTIIPTLIYEGSKQQWHTQKSARGIAVQDRISRLEANPKRAAALQRARAKLAAATVARSSGRTSLATLRLAAGLSQAQLAELMETQQSNVSRWERNPGDLLASSMIKLAKALKVEPATVFEAISHHQEMVEQ